MDPGPAAVRCGRTRIRGWTRKKQEVSPCSRHSSRSRRHRRPTSLDPATAGPPQPGFPEAKAEWYWAQQAHQAQLAAHNAQIAAFGRKKRSLPLPGTPEVLSLESSPQAKAEWYWAQQAHQAQLVAHNA